MINLEQVKLLETKVSRAIEYVERLTGENAALLQREADLQTRLESYQKRIDELELLILQFKEDQGRIEDGILAALDRLNQFESAIEKSLKEKESKAGAAAKTQAAKPEKPASPAPHGATQPAGEIYFEIPEAEPANDIADPLTGEAEEQPGEEQAAEEPPAENRELDIF